MQMLRNGTGGKQIARAPSPQAARHTTGSGKSGNKHVHERRKKKTMHKIYIKHFIYFCSTQYRVHYTILHSRRCPAAVVVLRYKVGEASSSPPIAPPALHQARRSTPFSTAHQVAVTCADAGHASHGSCTRYDRCGAWWSILKSKYCKS